ncbi:MAG: recombinase family protein [Alicyclobacillus sp.]|nr:recombinase family protein [Alicyclobacillus sp.]
MAVALYCRVSTDEQAEHGFSIDDQKERLEAFARSQGWTDYEWYIDDGYTGTNTDRPALRRLVRHVEQGRISTVVVYKLDRLGRRQRDILYLLEDVFETRGVAFRSVTEPIDTSTPLGKAVLGMLAVFAQLERDTIIQRSLAGQRQRRRQGLWSGRTPFGYRWDEQAQRMVVVPSEAELVRGVYERYLRGEPRYKIAQWLAGKTSSRYCDHTLIYDMLRRATYCGLVRAGDELVPGQHEPIVDRETWERAQRLLDARKRPYGRYLLSGLLTCGHCGGAMKHQQWRRKGGRYVYDFYICSRKQREGKAACPESRSHKQQDIDHLVVERLRGMHADAIAAALREAEAANTTRQVYEDVQARLEDTDTRLRRLVEAVASGLFSPDTIRGTAEQLQAEKRALELRLAELEDELSENRSQDWMAVMQAIGTDWETLTEDEQRSLLRAAVAEVILYADRRIEIRWAL